MKLSGEISYNIGDVVGFVDLVKAATRNSDEAAKWYLVQISDGLNNRDVDLLHRMQIDIYRPLMRTMKLVAKKHLSRAQRQRPFRPVREKVEPFFPGYAFLTFQEMGERRREIFKMTGVRGLVCANHQPVHVPLQMIEEIRAREVDGAVPAETKLIHLPYILGERVRIANGPFAYFSGTIERLPEITEAELGNLTLEELDESYRVHLLVDIFGRSTPIAMSVADIEKN